MIAWKRIVRFGILGGILLTGIAGLFIAKDRAEKQKIYFRDGLEAWEQVGFLRKNGAPSGVIQERAGFAVKMFQIAIWNWETAGAHLMKARCHFVLEEWEKAIAEWTRAVELDPAYHGVLSPELAQGQGSIPPDLWARLEPALHCLR